MYNKIKKVCALYASDEHLITMLIPYIYKEIENKKEIITIFEKDLTNISQKVLKTVKADKKIYEIDWNKTNINDLNLKLNKTLNNTVIIIVGNNKFIENVNSLLKNIKEDFININCYNIFKQENKIRDIIEEYENILTTLGIEKIKKTITCIG